MTELWDESNLITSLPILVDEERLVWIDDVFIVSGLVVLRIAYLSSLLIKCGCRTHAEVNTFHSVRLLVVLCDNSASYKGSGDCFLPVSFGFLPKLLDILEYGVSSDDLESNVDIE